MNSYQHIIIKQLWLMDNVSDLRKIMTWNKTTTLIRFRDLSHHG